MFFLVACNSQNQKKNVGVISGLDSSEKEKTPDTSLIIGHGFDFERNGKDTNVQVFSTTFITDSSFDFRSIPVSSLLKKELTQRRTTANQYTIDGLQFSGSDVSKAYALLSSEMFSELEAHQIKGEDAKGNVHFTGYFTPVLQVNASLDSIFQYPLYAYPKGDQRPLPTRKQIDIDGALSNRNLELAFAKDAFEVYTMQVQGSGIVEYPDGEQSMFRYAGNNGYKYKSIGRHLVESGEIDASELSLSRLKEWMVEHPDSVNSLLAINPSYVFFEEGNNLDVVGAEGTRLQAMISVAADPKYFPLGSLLVLERPVLDKNGLLIGKQKQWAIVQDVGGAIKGPGHIDMYCGKGKEGENQSKALHHYGKVWLILPK